jgi:hypothetical protein
MTVRIHTNITTAMLNPETIEISMLIQRYYLSLSHIHNYVIWATEDQRRDRLKIRIYRYMQIQHTGVQVDKQLDPLLLLPPYR